MRTQVNRQTRVPFTPLRKENYERRASAQGNGARDSFIKDGGYKFFKASQDDNRIRILYPTWENAEHHALDIYVHYSVGADKASFLCNQRMKNEPCPICEERAKAVSKGDEDYAKTLKPSHRLLCWVIDRKATGDLAGRAILWSMPWGFDKDVCTLSTDKETGELLQITDPHKGYDIYFKKEGTTPKTTKYVGVQIARNPSSVNSDAALDFISENPIPSVLNFHSYEHIKAVFHGSPAQEPAEDEVFDDAPVSKEERSSKTYTYDEIQALSAHQLDMLCDEFDIPVANEMTDDDIRNILIGKLGIQVPKEEAKPLSVKERMAKAREKM